VGLQGPRGNRFRGVQAGLHGHDLAADDHRRADLAEGHAQEVEDADPGAGSLGLDPEAEIARKDRQENQTEDDADTNDDDQDHLHRRLGE
jgi:hypothetical protein